MSTSTFSQSGSGYEASVGRWSRRVAEVFIDRLVVSPGSRWVDVGCGTGAVTQTILTRCEPASILGVDPSETFLEVARSSVDDPRVSFEVADGASLPLADDRSKADRADLRARIRAPLPIADDGSIPLTARAWAVPATA